MMNDTFFLPRHTGSATPRAQLIPEGSGLWWVGDKVQWHVMTKGQRVVREGVVVAVVASGEVARTALEKQDVAASDYAGSHKLRLDSARESESCLVSAQVGTGKLSLFWPRVESLTRIRPSKPNVTDIRDRQRASA